ncbi:isochorismatase family protein [Trematosphaeria pertusa]|uniref:Isochorismatase family protein n=1 Tax=Trematosphaeria pertusa TaxID=390896 RepID=A0A6A6IGR8_9PLEO|nr:isochorismatase family protein [Trematosphaeria pertusa]KAF2248733.1 isochorismatase family protein [Trematosphaeria pertusa]
MAASSDHFRTLENASDKKLLVVGHDQSNFWSFDQRTGWDLTHPATPSTPPSNPGLKLSTTTTPITIDPNKSALLIIDMQNYFLSSAMGRKNGEGHEAEAALLEEAIPAARKAGIQIVHLTWGISEEELAVLPPVIFRIFGFDFDATNCMIEEFENGREKESKGDGGIGEPIGDVTLPDGSVVEAGRLLMRDQWNTELHDPLKADFEASQNTSLPDLRFHKARRSGLWGGSTPCVEFLKEKGIKALLFSGVNTDQCVLATIQDASNHGFDTVLLRDGCGTTSPDYARKTAEYNCRKSWGFVSSCKALSDGAAN